MKHDGIIDLATGMGATSRIWKNKKIHWSALVKKLTREYKTNETIREYLASSKQDRGKIKDVGGYVAAYLRGGRRKPGNVVHRQALTLDLDFAHLDFWDVFTLQYNNAAVLHATHTHTAEAPKYRLIMPLSREVTPDEYVAISRRIAGDLDIELFDPTTFQPSRLMFWPSNPKDVEYYSQVQDGPWIDADEVLANYMDWTDSSLWPTSEEHGRRVTKLAEKQQDPELKKGMVGAFCRTYDIPGAIDTFLASVYSETTPGRYTYAKGSTASGLVTYEDKYAYSHHGTDPTGGKLCNAFDLVRLHLFGHLDSGTEWAKKTKSFAAMEDLVRKDPKVKLEIANERLTNAKYEFSQELTPAENRPLLALGKPEVIEVTDGEDNLDWAAELDIDARGKYVSSSTNLNLLFANDPRLKGVFRYNEFDNKRYVFRSLPWRKIEAPETVKNVDYSGVRNYIESIYGIVGTSKIEDSIALEFERLSFHPIREYLSGLFWDGVPRLDSLLVEYFGADNTIYVREATRKALAAAVARVFDPGAKFDLVLTLVGGQGTGKSTLVSKLGRGWSSDSFNTVHGKEAFEQLQGAWLIEMAELSGLRKAEIETVKHFISKQEDTFRPAYARAPETFKRQCIFIGTTNNREFLSDPSGNRRFMPVDIYPEKATKSIFKITDEDINGIWAEAVEAYQTNEKLYLSGEAEIAAKTEQKNHSVTDERAGLIEEFLDKKLPVGWDEMGSDARVDFADSLVKKGTETRKYVCIAEIWCECLGKDKADMNRYKTRELNDILRSLPGWRAAKSPRPFNIYGMQKYYKRN